MKPSTTAQSCLVAAVLAWTAPALALYKVVAPDGSVTYTDRPPQASAGRAVALGRPGAEAAPAALPAALREPAARFPVTLFTVKDCAPCDQGRALLTQRGIPFRERTAVTEQDREMWQRVVGTRDAPVLQVGAQTVVSLQSQRWQDYLDAAGYPRQSVLPPTYQAPPAEPLAPRGAPAPREVQPAPPSPAAEAALPPPSGGLRF